MCKTDGIWTDDCGDPDIVFEAMSAFTNLRHLIAKEGIFWRPSGLSLALLRFGELPQAHFQQLEYIEMDYMLPAILLSQRKNVVHISLRGINRYSSLDHIPFLTQQFPKLEFVTLDSHSLTTMWDEELHTTFYQTVTNLRIVWNSKDLESFGMSFQCPPVVNLTQNTFTIAIRALSRQSPLMLAGVQHLHMDMNKEAWDTNNLWLLDKFKKVCKDIGPGVKELVIRIPMCSVEQTTSDVSISNVLDGTFRSPSLTRLEGVVMALEMRSTTGAKLVQDDLAKGGIFLARRLECNANDIRWVTVPLLVTEGKEFGCKCHWRHNTDPEYLIRYFGEHLISYVLVKSRV